MNAVYVLLLGAAFVVIEALIGGTRLLFGIPAYLVVATAGLAALFQIRRIRALPNGFCLAATGLFLGYVLCRAYASRVVYTAWPDEFMVLGGICVYLLTACQLTDPNRRLWVLAVLVGLGYLNIAVGIRQFAVGDTFMLFGFARSERYAGRASGCYVCPDHLAFFLEVVGCLALAWAIWGRGPVWVKWIAGIAAVGLFGGELLTASRGGFLSASAGLAVMVGLGLIRLTRTAPRRVVGVLVLVVIAAVVAAFAIRAMVSRNALLQERAHDLVSLRDIRPRLWKAGLEQFHLSPLFGTGASTYLYYGRRLRDPSVQDDPIRTHCDYLELLGEYGAVGAVGLAVFLLAHLGVGWQTYRHFTRRAAVLHRLGAVTPGSNAAAWNIGALSAVTAMAAHSAVDFNLHIPANTLLAAFVFGILANPGRPTISGAPPVTRLRPIDWAARLTLAAASIVLFAGGAPRLPGEYFCEKARVAVRDRHFVAASGYALRGLAFEKRNQQLYFYLGEARLSLAGDGRDTPMAHSFREGADEAYRAGLALAPCDIPFLLRHGQVLTIFGDYPAAARVFEQALLWDPNSALVQTYYGFYLQHCGRLADARAAYARAMSLSPNAAAAGGIDQISKLEIGAN